MNTRYLRKRRQGWAVVVTVPKNLREKAAIFYKSDSAQKKEIVRELGTRDLQFANILKWQIIAEIRQELETLNGKAVTNPFEVSKTFDPTDRTHIELVSSMAETQAAQEGIKSAQAYYRIATRQDVPVSIHAETWLKELALEGRKQHTINDYKATMKAFEL